MARTSGQEPVGKVVLFVPLLFAVIGLPLALQLVPPNGFYGIRTSATLASESVWYTSNFWAGVAAVALGLPATALNLSIAKSPVLTATQKVVLPLFLLLITAGGMTIAGLAVT